MRRRATLALLPVAALAAALGGWNFFASMNRPRVSPTRLARLTRGINVSHWFAQAELASDHFRTYIGAEDVDHIEAVGFNHVRLSVDPLVVFDPGRPDRLKTAHLQSLDAALDMLLAGNLAVIVDIHPDDQFKMRLGADTAYAAQVASFWGALASHLAPRDPERVFLEAMNEPLVWSAERWNAIQLQLLNAMRQGAPSHTLIATGGGWSTVQDLAALTPVADPNVVYNFHFYEPFTFTYQGATWGDPTWQQLKNVPYPANPQAVQSVLADLHEANASQYVVDYGEERWDITRIEQHLLRAVAWGRTHGVSLTCNEFGVYRPVTPPMARIAWLRDVRTLLQRYAIGWSMWDYAGGFGVMVDRDNRRVVDPDTLQALGLA
jgi:aryl-phospho-beta-D-glucosidase BglC (GH1 family)